MSAHASLPPSSADKWMVCTAWLQATEGLQSKSSIYADDGTEAHAILEWSLRLALTPEDLTPNEETAEAVGHAVDWLSQYLVEKPEAKFHIERRLYFGKAIGYPALSGTSDLFVVHPEELVILDYKHGAGVVVEPETSKQLRLYLIGAIHEFGPRENYQLVVVQPRARHHNGPVRSHHITHAEIKSFAKEAKNAAKANFEKTGKRKAGEHCRFCLAAPTCRELANHSLSLAIEEFAD